MSRIFLRDFRLNLRERRGGVVVDLKVNQDRAQALGARRFHVIDAVGTGNNPLDRRGDETANQIGARANINRRDRHHGNVAAWILTYAQRANGL